MKSFISQSQSEQIYFSLCEKARLYSSMAKLQGGKKLYEQKNLILSKIFEIWPEKVSLIDTTGFYWFIHLENFGNIHIDPSYLTNKTIMASAA